MSPLGLKNPRLDPEQWKGECLNRKKSRGVYIGTQNSHWIDGSGFFVSEIFFLAQRKKDGPTLFFVGGDDGGFLTAHPLG